jgi:bifunctional enzyme CysN/CysC
MRGAGVSGDREGRRPTRLERLEAASIHVLREVAATSERAAMVRARDRDSAVLHHLALKAFHPARPPFSADHGTPGAGVVVCSERRAAPETAGRVFPLRDWSAHDVARYAERERLPVRRDDAADTGAEPEPEDPTPRLRFVLCGAAGGDTRTLLADASNADCAVVLADARAGLLTASRRHMTLVSLLGLRHVVVAVDGLDRVEDPAARFAQIEADAGAHAALIGCADVACIAFDEPALTTYLASVEVDEERMQAQPLRLPVQWVVRHDATFRGFAGTLAGGTLTPGDRVVVLPAGQESRVERIVTRDGDLERAVAGQAVVVTLADDVDVDRGDTIAHPQDRPEVADQFDATLVWMAAAPLLPGRSYLMGVGPAVATATVGPLKHKLDIETLGHMAATKLEPDEIGAVQLSLDRRIAFDPYTDNRETGGFVLVDRITGETVAAGLLRFALRRAANVHRQAVEVDKPHRAALKGQRPAVVWLTGLSGAGKSTIANLVDQRLHALGLHTYLLDGDNVRHGLCRDLGFTAADRVENIRRVGEVARLMVDAGLIVLASFISPYRNERRSVRDILAPGEFHEVYVDTPLALAEQRDRKGLYAKARRGELLNFTGVDAPYEAPEAPELRIDTTAMSAEEAATEVIAMLERSGVLGNHS